MRTLYLDCGMGAAGDMLAASLLELLPDPDAFVAELNALGIPGVTYQREASVKCGITGTRLSVSVYGEEEGAEDLHEHPHEHPHEHSHEHVHGHFHEHLHDHSHEEDHGHSHEHSHEHPHEHAHAHHAHHGHHHSGMQEIERLVRERLRLPDAVKEHVLAVYGLIAAAESHAHGVPVDEVHFHEVGTLDAVADVAAVCLLLDRLAPEQILASPVHVGSGQVRCAHGVLPVPAPATAHILRGAPIYGGEIRGELCTPTGAALLKHFVTSFGPMPPLCVEQIGYGMGKKDFPAANCVRALLGEAAPQASVVTELCCNLDDMTGEALGFAMDALFRAGALEVYTLPAGMKKSRPGVVLCVMCREEDRSKMLGLLFRHTSTLGVRESRPQRYTLRRSVETVETPYGPVRKKKAEGFGVSRAKYEYEDLARIAAERGVSLREAAEALPRA